MSQIPMFTRDYPPAFEFPCDAANCYNPANHGGVVNQPRAFILHTPEEPADAYPGTPHWFQNPAAGGSTIYFVSYLGEVFQIMPETWGAIANGLNGKPRPSWALPGSLNWQTLNVEIEGYAANIEQTMTIGGKQWNALVKLVRDRCRHYGIPLDRAHLMGHYELSVDRTDPGAGFPWDAFIAAVNEEEEMAVQLVWCPERAQLFEVGSGDPKPILSPKVADELRAVYGKEKHALSWSALQALGAK